MVIIGVITVNEALVVVTEVLLLGAIVAVPGDFTVPPVVILVKWAIGALFIPVTEGLLQTIILRAAIVHLLAFVIATEVHQGIEIDAK